MLATWPWLAACPCPLFTHNAVYISAQVRTPEEAEEAMDTCQGQADGAAPSPPGSPRPHGSAGGDLSLAEEATSHYKITPETLQR